MCCQIFKFCSQVTTTTFFEAILRYGKRVNEKSFCNHNIKRDINQSDDAFFHARNYRDYRSAVVGNNIEIVCPEMYTLSQNYELCYHWAGHWDSAEKAFHADVLSKDEAVQYCTKLANGTIPYSKCYNVFVSA